MEQKKNKKQTKTKVWEVMTQLKVTKVICRLNIISGNTPEMAAISKRTTDLSPSYQAGHVEHVNGCRAAPNKSFFTGSELSLKHIRSPHFSITELGRSEQLL